MANSTNEWDDLDWESQLGALNNMQMDKTIGLFELIYPNKTVKRISVTTALERCIKVMNEMDLEIDTLKHEINELEEQSEDSKDTILRLNPDYYREQ